MRLRGEVRRLPLLLPLPLRVLLEALAGGRQEAGEEEEIEEGVEEEAEEEAEELREEDEGKSSLATKTKPAAPTLTTATTTCVSLRGACWWLRWWILFTAAVC